MSRSVAMLALWIGLAAGLGGAIFLARARRGIPGAPLAAEAPPRAGSTDERARAAAAIEGEADAPAAEPGAAPAAEGERVASAPAPQASFLLGSVVAPGGEPIAGARVTLFDGPLFGPLVTHPPNALRDATTDALGRYRFVAPAADGLFGVEARAPGFATRGRNQSAGVDVPLELSPVGSWVGRVRGEGAENVRVLRLPAMNEPGEPRRVDDGAGAFALEDVPVGKELVLSVVPAQGLALRVTFTLPAPGVHARDIELGPRRRHAGLVLDAFSRRPVAGARLEAAGPLGLNVLATSDREGRFTFEVQGLASRDDAPPLDNDAFLSVHASGYLVSEAWLGLLARGAPLEMVPAARIEGRVLAADGTPAPNATVTWVGPLRTFDARFGSLAVPAAGREVRADAEGRFVLTEVPWGVARSELVARSGARERWVLDALPADAHTPLALEIRLPAGRALVGRVVWDIPVTLGRADLSAAHARRTVLPPAPRVTVRWLDAEGETLARAATDARGLFAFEEAPDASARLEVEGHAHRWLSAFETLGVHGDQPGEGARVTLAIEPPTRTLTGTLRTHDGEPLGQHEIAAQPSLGHELQETAALYGARTDAEGHFELDVPDFAGSAPVLLVQHGWTRLEREAGPGALDWTLPELASVTLVLDEEPERGRTLRWRGPRPGETGRSLRVERPLNGRLELELPLGELELELAFSPPDPRSTRRASVRVGRDANGSGTLLRQR
jgi:hypothetical protein